MKNRLYFPLIFAVCMLFATTANAQNPYDWTDYGLSFSVPADFKETASDGEKFEGEAKKSKIHLFGLYPIEDENVTKENLVEVLKMMAKESGMNVEEAEEIKFNGFEGVYGEGTIEGIPTFMACMLDPKGSLNFIVTIMHQNTNGAVALLKSIKKIKK